MDCKTGAPADAHGAQVAIYILCIPLAWKQPTLQLNGEVVYKTHRVPIHWESVQPMRVPLFALLRRIGAGERPPALPSEGDCQFCQIGIEDCRERWTPVSSAVVMTEEF